MAFQPTTLLVCPNPHHALDAKGRPAGACAEDPESVPGARRFVGATMRLDDETGDVVFDFVTEPVKIANTQYHRGCVQRGEILAADKATAKVCNISDEEYAEIAKLHADTKTAALAKWQDENEGGEPLPAAEPPKPEGAARRSPAKPFKSSAVVGDVQLDVKNVRSEVK